MEPLSSRDLKVKRSPGTSLFPTPTPIRILVRTSLEAGAAAKQAVFFLNTKYSDITSTHVFFPIAIETAGSWDTEATELIEELGRRITEATEDPKETTYLFQRISITIQRGNALSFFNTFDRNDV